MHSLSGGLDSQGYVLKSPIAKVKFLQISVTIDHPYSAVLFLFKFSRGPTELGHISL